MRNKTIFYYLVIMVLSAFLIGGCSGTINENSNTGIKNDSHDLTDNNLDVAEDYDIEGKLDENGFYFMPEEVAEYIHTYQKLPNNYITKKEAVALGWVSSEGNLWDVTEKMSIGGDVFGNREGILPKDNQRKWYECDVNYNGGYRGSERIIFSNDGLIYYTDDHYDSFTKLY